MIQEPIFYLIAVFSVLLAGISKSGFGGGLGVLAVPLMALVVPPGEAAAILLPILCLMDLFNTWHYRRDWDSTNLKILVPAALLGILAGTFFFRYLSDNHIRILIGSLAVAFVLNYFFRRANGSQTSPNRLRGTFWGAVAGFTSFGVHAGGPPVNVYLLPQKMHKTLFVGTTVVFFTIVNYTKLIPYGFLGLLNADNLLTSLLLSPLAPLGVFLGVKLHNRINERLFFALIYLFLLITGIKLIYDGVAGL